MNKLMLALARDFSSLPYRHLRAAEVFMTWWLASPRVRDPTENKKEARMSFMTWPQKLHGVIFATSY